MRRSLMLAAVAALTLSGCMGAMAGRSDPSPASYASVLADAGRPQADRDRDGARYPAETLAFAQVRPGQKVGEYMPGGGYFTRLLARAVGGEGRVHAFVPSEIVQLRAAYLTEAQAAAAEPGMGNVVVSSTPGAAYAPSEPLDMIFTAQNYHDFYGPYAPANAGAAFDRAAFAALKPGGLYVVIDHHAAAGTGLTGAAALHRIDRQASIDAITSAGFVLDGESEILVRADDPLSANVFDPSIRGKTSQFMLRFRKP